MNSKVIIACDFDSETKLNQFLDQFGSEKLFLKLGSQLIYSTGLSIINKLSSYGHKIFLDLKLHDITNTMVESLKILQQYPISMLTIHLTSGRKSLEKLSANLTKNSIIILGVSILTNLDNSDVQELFLNDQATVKQLVLNLTKIANESNLGGVVCSAQESFLIKQHFPQLITVCPGIQMATEKNDQKRVVSPVAAKQLQADYIVVGREITTNPNPYQVYQKIKTIFQGD